MSDLEAAAERAQQVMVEMDLMARLARLELPRPSRPADVQGVFDIWLAAELLDEGERIEILAPKPRASSRPTGPDARREEALAELFRLLQPGAFLRFKFDDCACVVDLLDDIRRILSPVESVMTFLHDQASSLVLQAWDQFAETPPRLRDFFEGSPLGLLAEGTVALPFGASVPLGRALDVKGLDGLDLCDLRALFPGHQTAFDAAVAARRGVLAPVVETGLAELFESPDWDREVPTPSAYLAAFGHLLTEGTSIGLIISEIEDRIAFKDGFDQGPDKAAWFGALATLRGWRAEHVRSLLHLDRDWAALGDEALQASLTAMEEIASSDRRSAALGAFHAHCITRWMMEAGRRLTDARRLRSVEERIGGLRGGSAIMDVVKHLAALPLPVPSRDCVWECFGEGTKAQWRWDVGAIVEEDRELAHGLAEFLIAFTTPEAYDDLEPLLFEVLHDAAGIRLLDEVSAGEAYLAATRARSIRRQMLTRVRAR